MEMLKGRAGDAPPTSDGSWGDNNPEALASRLPGKVMSVEELEAQQQQQVCPLLISFFQATFCKTIELPSIIPHREGLTRLVLGPLMGFLSDLQPSIEHRKNLLTIILNFLNKKN